MKSLQLKNISLETITWLSIFPLVILLFVFLQPKIGAQLFSEKRTDLLEKIVTKIKDSGDVPSRDFWEFREFYSPGEATFDKKGIGHSKIDRTSSLFLPKNVTAYLYFKSEKILSVDGLGTRQAFEEIAEKLLTLDGAKIISESDEHVLISSGNSYYLTFVKSQQESLNTNGIFQYWAISDSEEENMWINLTRIDL